MSTIEELRPGHTAERNSLGQFTKTTITSERAAEMGRSRTAPADDLADLLEEAGYTKDNPAPQSVITMGKQAIKQPAAMRYWMQMQMGAGDASYKPPGRGETCKLCGRTDQEGELSKLIAVLDEVDS